MLPNSIPERRKKSRTVMERLAYINIEPNNGGIVLNVSEEGLCFHSIAPVERNGKLRFSLLEQNHRIEADGELVWLDDAQKVGGLRFATISSEARAQINGWITEPASPPMVNDPRNSPIAFPHSRGLSVAISQSAAPAPALQALPSGRRSDAGLLSGFSGGLIIGLLVAALVTVGFLLHNHRRQLGESLIQMGQLLASKPQGQSQSTAQVSSTNTLSPSVRSNTSPAAPRPANSRQKVVKQSPASEPRDRETQKETNAVSHPLKVVKGAKAPASSTASIIPPTISPQSTGTNRMSGLLSERPVSLPRLESPVRSNLQAVDSGTDTSGAVSRMYFEVGKFKQQLWARKATDELAHLGFPATITQKSGIFKSSYYVLVGPYEDRIEADSAHKDLAARGFKARPFERGSRNFTLSSRVRLNGTDMPVGDFVIRWESYVPQAKVKFLQNDDLVATAEGKWVDRGVKNQRNAFVYERRADGSHTLLEIRFAGMSRVLVFGSPS